MTSRTTWLLLAACGCATSPAVQAETREITLAPPGTKVTFTTYAMSMFPLAGRFAQFKGELQVDPAHRGSCTVTINVVVASLTMADPARTRLALSPKLMDAAAFPSLTYRGYCGGKEASGTLTMHGISRPITFVATRDGNQVTAVGSLHRQDFGVSGLPGVIGRTIEIGFAVSLPDDVAKLVDR